MHYCANAPAVPNYNITSQAIDNSSNTLPTYVDVKYSQDGKYIVAAKDNGTVNRWNAADGKLLFIYNTHDIAIDKIALSPDGSLIALADNDGKVHILSATSGKQVSSPYDGKGGPVNALAWSPDGSLIASGYFDGTVHVWGVIGGRTATVYTYPALKLVNVYTLAWSPNGQRIASGYDDGTVQIWDATSGKNIVPYLGHPDAISSLAWSKNGNLIALDTMMERCKFGILPVEVKTSQSIIKVILIR